MSVKVMGLVWDLEINPNEKFVLLAYADHAAHDGTSIYPAVTTIAKKTGYSERSVQYITRDLEKAGYLVTDGEGVHGTNKWRIPIYGGVIDPTHRGADIAPVQSVQEGGAKDAPLGVQPIAPESSINRPINQERARTSSKPKILGIEAAIMADRPVTEEDLAVHDLWTGRDKVTEPIRELLDVYVELTGQRPTRDMLKDWAGTANDWLEVGIIASDLREAYLLANPPDGRGFLVSRPGSLTSVASKCAGDRRKKGISAPVRDPYATLIVEKMRGE